VVKWSFGHGCRQTAGSSGSQPPSPGAAAAGDDMHAIAKAISAGHSQKRLRLKILPLLRTDARVSYYPRGGGVNPEGVGPGGGIG
jgi:hypothetical protein